MTNLELGNGVHPRVVAELEEELANKHIAGLRTDMELWEFRMEEVLRTGDASLIAATEELDQVWQYHNQLFLVSGQWWIPRILTDLTDDANDLMHEQESFGWMFNEEDVFETRQSLGIGWRNVNGKKRLGFTFDTGAIGIQKPYVNIYFNPMAVALPEDVSLTYINAPTEPQGVVHSKRIKETLKLYDKLTTLYMTRPEFTQFQRTKQQRIIASLTQEANDLINSPGTAISIELETRLAYYRNEPSTSYGFQQITEQNESGVPTSFPLQGQMLGVGILEQAALDHHPLRDDQDFIDRLAGLCIIVEAYDLDGARQMYVPYSRAKVKKKNIQIYPAG